MTDLYTLPEKVHFFPENFGFWNSLLYSATRWATLYIIIRIR